MAKWMGTVEKEWEKRRGSKAKKMSSYERLDYHRGLSNQGLEPAHVVLFNAAGTDISAARLDRESLELSFVVESKLYGYHTASKSEAQFLTAILNSPTVNEAIKPFQSVGLQGERDVHTKPLGLPIPVFDPGKEEHIEIVAVAEEAEQVVSAHLAAGDEGSLANRRRRVREALAEVFLRLDPLVEALLSE